MTLIKSISGIRGTIGGTIGENLTPVDVVKFSTGYALWVKEQHGQNARVVIGRDARISGEMVSNLVSATLVSLGIQVVDLGLSTTPTVEMAVVLEKAHGGIILTASHNPKQWNALKLLNNKGEFVSGEEGKKILELSESMATQYSDVDSLGSISYKDDYMQRHVALILEHPMVNIEAVKAANFSVAVDGINSTGAIAVPMLLEAMGVNEIMILNEEPDGHFAHNPEPLKEHLTDLSDLIKAEKVDLGIVVDPDVDRLAFVNEDGSMFGEEYTLVAIADYMLGKKKGNTVSNLSSTKALRDVTEKHGGSYQASAVGEVNVVNKMKETNAVVGGEGNGGIIVPDLHYGRDALIGIALFLSHLAEKKCSMTELKASYPAYYMSKNKIQLTDGLNPDEVLGRILEKYQDQNPLTIDGVKIEINDTQWVHMRKSNTEPIIRVYTESETQDAADELGRRFVKELGGLSDQ